MLIDDTTPQFMVPWRPYLHIPAFLGWNEDRKLARCRAYFYSCALLYDELTG